MSIFKRLTNIAKGQVKVWQNGEPTGNDALLDAELRATQSADRAATEGQRIKAEGAVRRSARHDAAQAATHTSHKHAPIPRTDLFGNPVSGDESAQEPQAEQPHVHADEGAQEQQVTEEPALPDPFQAFDDPDNTWKDQEVPAQEPKRSL